MKELISAIRQYKHNDGSEGFVMAYDRKVTEEIVCKLKAEIKNIKETSAINSNKKSFLCKLGFHKWIYIINTIDRTSKKRRCEKCNKIQDSYICGASDTRRYRG